MEAITNAFNVVNQTVTVVNTISRGVSVLGDLVKLYRISQDKKDPNQPYDRYKKIEISLCIVNIGSVAVEMIAPRALPNYMNPDGIKNITQLCGRLSSCSHTASTLLDSFKANESNPDACIKLLVLSLCIEAVLAEQHILPFLNTGAVTALQNIRECVQGAINAAPNIARARRISRLIYRLWIKKNASAHTAVPPAPPSSTDPRDLVMSLTQKSVPQLWTLARMSFDHIPEEFFEDKTFKKFICPITEKPIRYPAMLQNAVPPVVYEKEALEGLIQHACQIPKDSLSSSQKRNLTDVLDCPYVKASIEGRLKIYQKHVQDYVKETLSDYVEMLIAKKQPCPIGEQPITKPATFYNSSVVWNYSTLVDYIEKFPGLTIPGDTSGLNRKITEVIDLTQTSF